MTAAVGFILLIVIIGSLLTKKVSVHMALAIPPIVAALILGFSISDIGSFCSAGITSNAGTGIMLAFAVLFFSILYDAGMFDPVIGAIIRIAGGDPAKITVATCVVSVIAHLDGSGATTFLIACSAFLPVYTALGMRPIVLAMCTGMTAGIMNLIPWGGPTLRAATSLSMDATELFLPMLPWMVVGMAAVFVMAWVLGLRERKRVGVHRELAVEIANSGDPERDSLKRPKLTVPNLVICLGAIVVILFSWLPAVVVFVVLTPVILILNYPDPKEQQKRIMAAAPNAFYTASVIFTAGILTGVLSGTGMVEAMALAVASVVPTSLGAFVTPIIGFFAPILYVFIDADSFYYGLLPVLAASFEGIGVDPVKIAHAMLIGQIIFACQPVTASSWLLCSYVDVDMSDMQKHILPMGLIIAVLLILVGLPLGII